MSKTCRLLSTNKSIPSQNITIGSSITIGRNRECRIRGIKCNRNYCSVAFDGKDVNIDYLTNGLTQKLTNGDLLSGPGFQYEIVVNSDCHQSNNGLNTGQEIVSNNSDVDDQNVFAHKILVKPSDLKTKSTATEWEILCSNHVHICRFLGGGPKSQLICAFDFDGTLVVPKSGQKYAIDGNDWELLDKSLPKRIGEYVKNGYRFVIISNQLPISNGRMKLSSIKKRFEAALTAIGFPCLVLIGAFDDIYRKPRPGLWQLLTNEFSDKPIDLKNSFYVGDAAGREKQLNGKSDHSSCDLLFAANINLPFLTPERFISDFNLKTWESNKRTYSGFEIKTFKPERNKDNFIAEKTDCHQQFKDITDIIDNYTQRLHGIILCGLPASGKSSFYSNYLKNCCYTYVSRDELKTIEKCIKLVKKSLKMKQNCVIDNLNVDKESRLEWIEICKRYSAIPILFHFDMTVEQAIHNDMFRRIVGINSPVTELIIRAQFGFLSKPLISEGFESIYKINFLPNFQNEVHEKLYYMYLSDDNHMNVSSDDSLTDESEIFRLH